MIVDKYFVARTETRERCAHLVWTLNTNIRPHIITLHPTPSFLRIIPVRYWEGNPGLVCE